MKTLILIALLSLSCFCFSQNKAEKAAGIDQQYLLDSVYIENIVEFYTHYDISFKGHDAVRFKVKITNLGSQPIPNLIRVSNRIKFLTLMYNGEDALNLSIGNSIESGDWPWFIEAGESDEFYTSYVLDKDSRLFLYDQPLNVTWKYMGVQSSTEIIDLINKRVF